MVRDSRTTTHNLAISPERVREILILTDSDSESEASDNLLHIMSLRIARVLANRGRHSAFSTKRVVAEAAEIADVDVVRRASPTALHRGTHARLNQSPPPSSFVHGIPLPRFFTSFGVVCGVSAGDGGWRRRMKIGPHL
jgi:hypothetical protein